MTGVWYSHTVTGVPDTVVVRPRLSVTVTVGDTPSAPGLPWGPVSPAAPRGRPKVSFTTPSVPVPLVTVAAAPVPSVVAATSMFSIFFSLLAAAAA